MGDRLRSQANSGPSLNPKANGSTRVSVFDVGSGGEPPPPPPPTDNEPPLADAGDDQQVGSAVNVTLDGSNSDDSDGNIVTYQWRQLAGKSVKLKNSNQVLANFKSPRLRRGKTYTLVFELTVTDDQGASAVDQTIVEVR